MNCVSVLLFSKNVGFDIITLDFLNSVKINSENVVFNLKIIIQLLWQQQQVQLWHQQY